MLLTLVGTIASSVKKQLEGIGTYWYSITNNNWFSLANWYSTENLSTNAASLPSSTTHVVVVSSTQIPFIDLNTAEWTQPASINAAQTGGTFYASPLFPFEAVTCSLSGNWTFDGNCAFNIP